MFNWLIYAAYTKALEDSIAVLDKIAVPIDVNDRKYPVSLINYDGCCWVFSRIHTNYYHDGSLRFY